MTQVLDMHPDAEREWGGFRAQPLTLHDPEQGDYEIISKNVPGMPLLCKIGDGDAYLVQPFVGQRLRHILTGVVHIVRGKDLGTRRMWVQPEEEFTDHDTPWGQPIPIDGFWIVAGPRGEEEQ